MIVSAALALVLQASPKAAPSAQSIELAKMRQTVALHKSVKGDISYTRYGETGKGSFAFLAPGFFKITDEGFSVVSDGLKGIEIRHDSKTYLDMAPSQLQDVASAVPGFSAVLAWTKPTKSTGPEKTEKVGSVDAIAIPIEAQGTPKDYTGVLYLDPKSSLPLMLRAYRSGTLSEEYRFENVVFDSPLTAADFSMAPPEGYKKLDLDNVTPPTDTTSPAEAVKESPAVAASEPASPAASRGTAGAWTNGVKVGTKIGTGKVLEVPYWTFTVYAKDAAAKLDWPSLVGQAKVKAGWRRVIFLGNTKDGGMVFGCEKKETAAPTALSLNLHPKDSLTPVKYGFEWKPSK